MSFVIPQQQKASKLVFDTNNRLTEEAKVACRILGINCADLTLS